MVQVAALRLFCRGGKHMINSIHISTPPVPELRPHKHKYLYLQCIDFQRDALLQVVYGLDESLVFVSMFVFVNLCC